MNLGDAINEFRAQLDDAISSSKTNDFNISANYKLFRKSSSESAATIYIDIDNSQNTRQVDNDEVQGGKPGLLAFLQSGSKVKEQEEFIVAFHFADIGNSGFELVNEKSSITPVKRYESVQSLFVNELDGYAKAFQQALFDALANEAGSGSDNDGDEKKKED